MTKADYDRLRTLSRDADYLLALEELFERSAYTDSGRLPIPVWVWIVAGSCLAGGAAFWLWLSQRASAAA